MEVKCNVLEEHWLSCLLSLGSIKIVYFGQFAGVQFGVKLVMLATFKQ